MSLPVSLAYHHPSIPTVNDHSDFTMSISLIIANINITSSSSSCRCLFFCSTLVLNPCNSVANFACFIVPGQTPITRLYNHQRHLNLNLNPHTPPPSSHSRSHSPFIITIISIVISSSPSSPWPPSQLQSPHPTPSGSQSPPSPSSSPPLSLSIISLCLHLQLPHNPENPRHRSPFTCTPCPSKGPQTPRRTAAERTDLRKHQTGKRRGGGRRMGSSGEKESDVGRGEIQKNRNGG
eukprot:755232-Hanusia_phi.AAC.2